MTVRPRTNFVKHARVVPAVDPRLRAGLLELTQFAPAAPQAFDFPMPDPTASLKGDAR